MEGRLYPEACDPKTGCKCALCDLVETTEVHDVISAFAAMDSDHPLILTNHGEAPSFIESMTGNVQQLAPRTLDAFK